MCGLLALLLALAPQPPLGEGDDFNEVVKLNEQVTHCEAVALYRTEPDNLRLVVFRCGDGDKILPFMFKGAEGWFPIPRAWKLDHRQAPTTDI